jgi:hypothetical protein
LGVEQTRKNQLSKQRKRLSRIHDITLAMFDDDDDLPVQTEFPDETSPRSFMEEENEGCIRANDKKWYFSICYHGDKWNHLGQYDCQLMCRTGKKHLKAVMQVRCCIILSNCFI